MIISLIVAVDEGGGIGLENRLPWRLATDVRLFKEITMGHHIMMGRKTFETIGRPLPGRTTVIITRNPAYVLPANCPSEACKIVFSLREGLELAEMRGEDEAFIIGGSEIFLQALPLADQIYLTVVHTRAAADVFFPPYEIDLWEEEFSQYYSADEKNEFPFTFKRLVRKVPVKPGIKGGIV